MEMVLSPNGPKSKKTMSLYAKGDFANENLH